MAGILKASPYLNVQTLGVSRIIINVKCLGSNSETQIFPQKVLFSKVVFLITINPVMPRHQSLGKIIGTIWTVEILKATGMALVTQRMKHLNKARIPISNINRQKFKILSVTILPSCWGPAKKIKAPG